MSPVPLKMKARALTFIEVLVLISVIGILLLLVLPMNDHPHIRRATTAACSNNLKQIGAGLCAFAVEHGDQFPPQVSITNGGSMEFVGRGGPAAHFRTLTNDIAPYWTVWTCPTDKNKKPATNYAGFDDHNVSYFLSMDAAPTNAQAQSIILAGDRHLEFAGRPVRPGLFTLTTNTPVSWTRELHKDAAQSPGGVVLFADGHVEFLGHARVASAIQGQSLATNRLAVP